MDYAEAARRARQIALDREAARHDLALAEALAEFDAESAEIAEAFWPAQCEAIRQAEA